MMKVTEIIATSSDFVKHSQSVNFQETTSRFNKIYYLYKALIIR
jgi:hypothetical protein